MPNSAKTVRVSSIDVPAQSQILEASGKTPPRQDTTGRPASQNGSVHPEERLAQTSRRRAENSGWLTMNQFGIKGRDAHCDILRAACFRGAVAHPLSAMRGDGLARLHIDSPRFCLDSKQAPQHYGVLIKFGGLTGLSPS